LGEFGIYRQNSGGNYFISVEQVISSLNLERIKLFKKLDLPRENNILSDCCTATLDLSEEELHLLDVCFSETSNLTSIEKSSLYYVSGYITRKEGLHDSSYDYVERLPESEFTKLLSRGKLSHPPAELYDLSQYFLCYFKMKDPKCCNTVFLQAFKLIYESTGYEFDNIDKIIRRFVNCFFKTFAKNESEKLKAENDKLNIKKRRLSSR
jgi:hypothetical protein